MRMLKGGRELMVGDADVESYIRDGWQCIDDKGNPIPYTRRLTYEEAMKRIASLEKHQETLQNQLNEAYARLRQYEVVEKKSAKAKKE